MPTRKQLEALAAQWEAEAQEEMDSSNGSEYSREALVAGVFEQCARELRKLLIETAT